jgi:glycosyltransferase involved in cell wall biosynthesis
MLARTLESLVAAAKPQRGVVIHVIENGSQVAEALTLGFADRLEVRYYYRAQGNKSAALNFALASIPADALLVFFDDDIKLQENVLLRYEAAAETFGPGNYFGGGLRADYEVSPKRKLIPYLPNSAKDYDLAANETYKFISNGYEFLGANWACFHQDLQVAGYFSPEFGPGSKSGARGQETDAQMRLFKNGVKPVAVGNATVDHWVPAKFVQADWIVERIFLSSIHLGRENASLIKSAGMLIKLQFSWLQTILGDKSIGPRYRIAKAAGYFKGLVTNKDYT